MSAAPDVTRDVTRDVTDDAPGRADAPRALVVCALLAAAAAAALHLAFGDTHLNLADEGYLWYGVVGVLDGEVPFRDFQAYDPGRYYWCAAFSALFGDGIVGVRAAVAVFQALGLFAGLLVARRFVRSELALAGVAVLLAAWMFPRHKLFEPAIALLVTLSVVRLLERPDARRHLETGLMVGLVAFLGRNHGLYAGLSALAAFALLRWRSRAPGAARRLGALALGVLLGYAPMLAMLALVPGFAAGFGAALADLVTKGANIPQPYPWPWRVDLEGAIGLEAAARVAVAAGFLVPMVVLPVAALRLWHERGAPLARDAALVGTTLVGLFYVHHVTVRSDAPHLGQCVQPLLLAALALPRGRATRAAAAALLAAITLGVALQSHTTLRWFAPWRGGPPQLHAVEVAGEVLQLVGGQAQTVLGLQREVEARLGPSDEIFVAPSRPTYYPLLGRRAPTRDIYLFWFASEEDQRALIQALETRAVRWVLLVDTAVDDREDLRFSNTHPLVWRHVLETYERVPTPALRPNHLLFRRRDG